MRALSATEMVPCSYWTCAIASHRHRSVTVAQACIDRHASRVPRLVRNDWTDAAMEAASRRHEAGETLKAIAASYGITAGRMGEVIHRWKRIQEFRAEAQAQDEVERLALRYYAASIAMNPSTRVNHRQPWTTPVIWDQDAAQACLAQIPTPPHIDNDPPWLREFMRQFQPGYRGA